MAELNYQANWELVIMLILNKRVKWWMNDWKSYMWTADKEVVEHCTSIAKAMGSNPVLAWIIFFFEALFFK